MSSFSIDDLDAHILNLQSQLSFLAEALDAVDHDTDPEWLATDLISLKGKTSMLCDDMRQVKKRMVRDGIRTGAGKAKGSNKRLSLENSKPAKRARGSSPQTNGGSSDVLNTGDENGSSVREAAAAASTEDKEQAPVHSEAPDDYQVQYIDVTEEVNRRLRESRLRQLMESPSTSQKRKYDAFGSADVNAVDDGGGGDGESELDLLRSPTKKVRTIGEFQQIMKLNEGVKRAEGDGTDWAKQGDGREERTDVKRRRI